MNSLTDQQLLRDYIERHSQAAFAELVRRHVDFVYSAALRMVRDAHLAEDVTQGVFVAFAQSVRQLTDRPVLSGWLHRTAQNLAANAVRTDVRRRAREQEAAAMNELLATESDASWEQIAPLLDAALGELTEPDRDALLLRYFERKSAREMAQILGVSDEAAQKRVSRAVDRLREFFAKRGITVGASGLVVVISANAVQAAPIGLAVAISSAAALVGTTFTTTATATATKAIAMTTLQKTLITIALVAVAGAGIYEAQQAAQLRKQNKQLVAEREQLISERDKAVSAEMQSAENSSQHQKDRNELLRLRSEVGMLRKQTNELTKLQNQAGQQRVQTSAEASPSGPANSTGDYVARDQYAFAGYAEPESAVKSMHWAMSQGDVKNVFASVSPNEQRRLKDQWAGRTEAEISAGLTNDNDNKKVLGYRITSKDMVSQDEMIITIYQEGRNKEKKMRLERVGNEWKYAGPPRQ